MRRCHWILAAFVAGVVMVPVCARAKSPEATFEELFGAQAKAVAATRSTRDDLALARNLLSQAARLRENPAFRNHLYERAFEFALVGPGGHATAAKALDELEKALPDRADEWAEKRLALDRARFAAASQRQKVSLGTSLVSRLLHVGDARGRAGKWDEAGLLYHEAVRVARAVRSPDLRLATEKVNAATARKLAGPYEAKLRRNPKDAAARQQIIELYVTRLDDPAGAARFVTPAVPEPWRTCVPLAAAEVGTLSTRACREMGDWYRSLVTSHGRWCRTILGRRVRGYYGQHLAKARAEGMAPAKIERARRELNAALEKIAQPALDALAAGGDAAVKEAVGKAIAYLKRTQQSTGCWNRSFRPPRPSRTSSRYRGRTSSRSPSRSSSPAYTSTQRVTARETFAAVLALIESGAPLTDPAIDRGLGWMVRYNTDEIRAIGLRSEVWQAAERRMPGKFIRRLHTDLQTLLTEATTSGYPAHVPEPPPDSVAFHPDSPGTGTRSRNVGTRIAARAAQRHASRDPSLLSRSPTRTRRTIQPDLYATSYGHTGVGAAADRKLRVPQAYWTVSGRYWAKAQRSDGSWRTRSTSYPTQTAAGVAALATCLARRHGAGSLEKMAGKDFTPLRRAMAYLGKALPSRLEAMKRSARPSRSGYSSTSGGAVGYYEFLYELSRATAATGQQAFGEYDVYPDARAFLLTCQGDTGQWGSSAYTTALATLTLLRGARMHPAPP